MRVLWNGILVGTQLTELASERYNLSPRVSERCCMSERGGMASWEGSIFPFSFFSVLARVGPATCTPKEALTLIGHGTHNQEDQHQYLLFQHGPKRS